ncbi:50S ribosomal protein L15 [Patescibacteria group bacterium]|nr:50S ribosomal protein L15 [Patescibacteria group bacterium]
MSLTLHTIKPSSGSRKKVKRVGRGLGSTGTYSGRGQKGQRARSGGKGGLKLLGMKRIIMSTPKLRGFKSPYPKMVAVNVGDLEKKFNDNERVTPKTLLEKGLVGKMKVLVKILGSGEIKKKLIIENCAVSVSAKEKIEHAGGKII